MKKKYTSSSKSPHSLVKQSSRFLTKSLQAFVRIKSFNLSINKFSVLFSTFKKLSNQFFLKNKILLNFEVKPFSFEGKTIYLKFFNRGDRNFTLDFLFFE